MQPRILCPNSPKEKEKHQSVGRVAKGAEPKWLKYVKNVDSFTLRRTYHTKKIIERDVLVGKEFLGKNIWNR